jgi:hypothetical protein
VAKAVILRAGLFTARSAKDEKNMKIAYDMSVIPS